MDLVVLKAWLQAKFSSDERGAALVEYGLLLALIAVVAIAALTLLGGKASDKFSGVAGNL